MELLFRIIESKTNHMLTGSKEMTAKTSAKIIFKLSLRLKFLKFSDF